MACMEQLEEMLALENVTTLAEVMRALKGIVATGSKKKGATGGAPAPTLSAGARRRVEALAAREPRKLGKAAAALMG
jgi:hypothetical protein